MRVSPDGRTLYVEGSYGLGGEEAGAPGAGRRTPASATVVLAGPGGRISVGFELYEMFRERKLATRVDDECASACTIAFLGGVERSISPGGGSASTAPAFPASATTTCTKATATCDASCSTAPSSRPQFVDRVFATPPDEIWVPTPQELLAGRVINRVNH